MQSIHQRCTPVRPGVPVVGIHLAIEGNVQTMNTTTKATQQHSHKQPNEIGPIQLAGLIVLSTTIAIAIFGAAKLGMSPGIRQNTSPQEVFDGGPGGGDPVVETRDVRKALRRFKAEYAPVLSKSDVGRSKSNTPRTVEDVLVDIVHHELSAGRKKANASDSDKQISAGR